MTTKNPTNIFKTEVWRQLKTSLPHLVVRGDPLPVLEVAAICAGCSRTCSRSHEGIWRRNQKDVLPTGSITVQQRHKCFSTSRSTDSRTDSITDKCQSHMTDSNENVALFTPPSITSMSYHTQTNTSVYFYTCKTSPPFQKQYKTLL